jgi:hypothetical protein
LPSQEPALGRFAQADLRYIGVAGPLDVDGKRMLYFALVSYGPWSTPLEVTYHIAIDIDNDNLADFRLQNGEATDVSPVDFASSDEFVSLLEDHTGMRKIQGLLNLYPSTQFETRPFDNNVMILPLQLEDLGEDVESFRYQVTSTSRDLTESSETIEITPILSLALNRGTGIITDRGAPLFPVAAGDLIQITFDRAAYVHQHTDALLLLYLHNESVLRSQTLPVQVVPLYIQRLPIIAAE